MSKVRIILKLLAVLAVCLLASLSVSAKKVKKPPPLTPSAQKRAGSYDASRDPAQDLREAIALATKTNKRILLEVGGDWCVYCNIMDETFETHRDLRKVRDADYVNVKVNYSTENPNQAFLSQYPKIVDYPHFFVLDSKGVLLHSQPTHPFEHGKNYNAGKIEAFLRKWSQPPRHLFTRID